MVLCFFLSKEFCTQKYCSNKSDVLPDEQINIFFTRWTNFQTLRQNENEFINFLIQNKLCLHFNKRNSHTTILTYFSYFCFLKTQRVWTMPKLMPKTPRLWLKKKRLLCLADPSLEMLPKSKSEFANPRNSRYDVIN